MKNNKVILCGNHNLQDRRCDVLFKHAGIHVTNYIITKDKSKTELAQYLHGCDLSPVISNFQECTKKYNFVTWPGIDDLNFNKLIKIT